MKTLFAWSGVVVIGAWLATMLYALAMMWDPAWMSAEHDPPSEIATGVIHFAAACIGILLGLSLCLKTVRSRLNGLQKVSFVVALALGLVTFSRFW